MGRLFDLIIEHRQAHEPYPPSYARIAEQVGVSRQTLLNWRTPTKLLDKEHLEALAEVTRVPYERVLDALLEDIGYLRKEQKAAVGPPRKRAKSAAEEGAEIGLRVAAKKAPPPPSKPRRGGKSA